MCPEYGLMGTYRHWTWPHIFFVSWARGYKTVYQSQTQTQASWLANPEYTLSINHSACLSLSLRFEQSFVTSGLGVERPLSIAGPLSDFIDVARLTILCTVEAVTFGQITCVRWQVTEIWKSGSFADFLSFSAFSVFFRLDRQNMISNICLLFRIILLFYVAQLVGCVWESNRITFDKFRPRLFVHCT